MKYILLSLVLFFPFISYAQTYTPQQIAYMVATTANEHGVDPKLALFISYKESGWNEDAEGDFSTTTNSFTSFGVSQIHLPAHADISQEQALDPIFSINFLVENLAEGNCKWWSTCPEK